MGSLPAVGALIVLAIFFSFAESGFFSARQPGQHVHRRRRRRSSSPWAWCSCCCSARSTWPPATPRASARPSWPALLGYGWPWPLARARRDRDRPGHRLFHRQLRAKVRMPSFVVTLALFLGLPGRRDSDRQQRHGQQGNITLNEQCAQRLRELSTCRSGSAGSSRSSCVGGYAAVPSCSPRARGPPRAAGRAVERHRGEDDCPSRSSHSCSSSCSTRTAR